MDQLKNFFTTKTALILIIIGVLLAGIAGGVYLTQRQTQLRSQAVGTASCKVTSICGQPATGNSPADCKLVCASGKAVYHCIQSDNPNCVADISCQPDDAKCTVVPPQAPAPANPGAATTPGVGGASTCPSVSLENISNETLIAKCTLAEIAQLPNDRLMTFSMDILTQLPNPRLEQFSLDFLAKFSNERLQQLSLGTLAKLPNERLQQFTIPFLQNFPNDRLITMSTVVLKQFPESRIRTFPCEVQIQLGYTCSGTAGDNVGDCSANILDGASFTPITDVVSTNPYLLRVTMTNTGTTTWDLSNYLLKPSTATITDWGLGSVPLKNSQGAVNVAPNGSATFNLPVTAPSLANNQSQSKSLSFRMANGVNEFGPVCQTGNINITSTATGGGTDCYILSENLADISSVVSCSDANAKSKGIVHLYASDPSTVPYTIVNKTAGVKIIYVRFISKLGQISDGFNEINFSPDPFVQAVACTQSSTGSGTVVALSGTNFGTHAQQGPGTVTVNGTTAQITLWDPARGLIQATIPTRLDGALSVDLKVDDGRTVTGSKCTIGVSSLQFTVSNQCTKPDAFSVDNVDATIVQNVTGAKPIIQTKINISKGVPTNFTPNLEANKSYSLILKAPRTLAKRTDFTTTTGTANLGQIKLFIGDIAPFSGPDGAINALDNSEMNRQWSLSSNTSTAKTASLTDHKLSGIVNSLDWSCLKLGIGKQDDDLTLAALTTTTTNRAVPLKGKVYLDSNSNNVFDTGETIVTGVTVKALYPAAVQTPGQKLTPAQAVAATVLGTTTTDANGNYSFSVSTPVNTLNLVVWVDSGSSTGQGGQAAVGIGAFTDAALQQSPMVMDIGVKP
ncbi:MAG: hypothetical protein Q7R49_02090 [Candidatus Daviesbacteria bacterium]|nr:hypothetical protein [Candidatus Daviesbacteria bacterium]